MIFSDHALANNRFPPASPNRTVTNSVQSAGGAGCATRAARMLGPCFTTDISARWHKERRYEKDSSGNDVQRSRKKPAHHAADMGARQRGHRDRNERTAVLAFCEASAGRGK